MAKKLTEALRKLPRQEILAFAESLFTIARAQVAAGKKPTPREQQILDDAARILPNSSPRKPT